MTGMRKPWSKEECTQCGVEGLASRSEPTPKSKPYVCEGCEMYDRGHADAGEEVAERMAQLEQLVEEAAVLSGAPYEDWRPWLKRRIEMKGFDESRKETSG